MAKGTGKVPVLIVVFVVLLLAFAYVKFFGNKFGVRVSCEDKKIVRIEKVPPPFLVISQPVICQVEINVTSMGEKVCSGRGKVLNVEEGTIYCKNLEDYKGKGVDIVAVFYSADGTQRMGEDSALNILVPEK